MNDDRPAPTKDEWTQHDTRVAIFFALLFFVIGPAVLIGALSLCMPRMRMPGGPAPDAARENARTPESVVP